MGLVTLDYATIYASSLDSSGNTNIHVPPEQILTPAQLLTRATARVADMSAALPSHLYTKLQGETLVTPKKVIK
jgi:hypothetical protein